MAAIFVVTPGRCGTQWLAGYLSALAEYNDVKEKYWITHEPLHLDYKPSHNTPAHPLKHNANIIVEHKKTIERHLLAGGCYVECGFPCWRHIAWFRKSFADICSVGVIYIHRDPVANAISLLKLSSFVPSVIPGLPEKLFFQLTADSHMSVFSDLWDSLSPFEKNLIYWGEVQLQARTYMESWYDGEWLTVDFENLFTIQTQKLLTKFVGFPNYQKAASEVADGFDLGVQCPVDTDEIYDLKKIREIAKDLGYVY